MIDIEKCKKLIDENKSYAFIAKELDINVFTLRRKLNQVGIYSKYKPLCRIEITESQLKECILKNFSIKDICKEYNCSRTNVRYLLNKFKLKTNPRPKGFSKYNYTSAKNRGISRKLHFIKLRGGKCELCGYSKNLAALSFHHLNPSLKSFSLEMRSFTNKKIEDLENEASKCQVLCQNCHMEIEHPHLFLN